MHILLKPFYLRRKRRRQVSFMRTGLRGKLMNPQFVTFLQTSRFRRMSLDKHEIRMRRKAVWARMSLLIGALIFGWIVIESAQAITLF